MKSISLLLLAVVLSLVSPRAIPAEGKTDIRLLVGGEIFPAVLEDSPAGRDFLLMLPLTLCMRDYNSTEKIAALPRGLSTRGAPDGFAPVAGDLAFYAPWGNLALFYRNFHHSGGLIRLGHLLSGVERLAAMPDDTTVTIERTR